MRIRSLQHRADGASGRDPDAPQPGWRETLWRTSLASLARFHVREAGILARSATWNGTAWVTTEPSPLNTANALVALYALQRYGVDPPLDPDTMMTTLVRDYLPGAGYQEVALMLWADALGPQRYGGTLWSLLDERLRSDVSQTMGLAWTLSALCHYLPGARNQDEVASRAQQLYRRIAANQSSRSNLFHASAAREGFLRRRSPVATLASQTYPIQSLALYARALDQADALERARRCAATLCRLQGPRGQWWWRYHVRRGTVSDGYPIYIVNQDGAIPMAFAELHQTLGERRYAVFVERGLAWLFGDNELQRSLVDPISGAIGRAIHRQGDGFSLDREVYSYQPARTLYALCVQSK